jgi:branched-subunit amino acid transport protein
MKFWIMLALMVLVTYLPRALPLVVLGDIKLSPFWERFFKCVPFTVMAALVFPGIFTSTGDPLSASAAVAVSAILAWKKCSPTVVVFAAVAVVAAVKAFL